MARTFPLALVVLLICAAAAFAAAKRADLGMLKVAPTSTELRSGGDVTIRYRIGNAGKASAGPSQIGFYLSADERKSSNDVLLGRRSVGRIAAGRAKAGSATFKVPNAAGLFRVIACADDKQRVRESSEANNCRSNATDLHVG